MIIRRGSQLPPCPFPAPAAVHVVLRGHLPLRPLRHHDLGGEQGATYLCQSKQPMEKHSHSTFSGAASSTCETAPGGSGAAQGPPRPSPRTDPSPRRRLLDRILIKYKARLKGGPQVA